jgi:hypothetical protein
MATPESTPATDSRSVEDRVDALTAAWVAGRGPSSFVADLTAHPAYQQIIILSTRSGRRA